MNSNYARRRTMSLSLHANFAFSQRPRSDHRRNERRCPVIQFHRSVRRRNCRGNGPEGTAFGQLELQKGSREELLQDYRKAVVSAFTDVEKVLVGVEQLTRQEQLQRDAVAQSQKAFDLSEERLQGGNIDLTTLLTTEQTLFTQQDTLAQVRLMRLEAIVSLFQALGGGWPDARETRASLMAEGGRSSVPDASRRAP